MSAGTKNDPWVLKTPPGTSEYTMYRDDEVDPPLLVCQVGSTKLTYLARAVDDLRGWLGEQGDWVSLGSADEGKNAAPNTVEEFGRVASNPIGGWYGTRKGYRGRFGMYLPPLLEELGPCRSDARRSQQQDAFERRAMSSIKVVRYQTKPELAEENAELVRAVFAELAAGDPGGLRYMTLRLEDGVTFVHVAMIEGDTNALSTSPAFQRFQSAIAERCDQGPVAMDASVVGSYSLPMA